MPYRDDSTPPWRDPADLSPLWMILRHPLILIFFIALCGGGAYGYLNKATPLYVSTALLRVQQPPPQAFGAAEPSRSPEETAVFLNAEMAVLTSTPVLETALANSNVRSTATAQALAASPDPLIALRKHLHANLGRKDDLIGLEMESPVPADAAVIVNTVVDTYVARQSRQREDGRQKMLAVLESQKADQDAAVAKTTQHMLSVLKQAGAPALDSRANLAELTLMRANLRASEQEQANAQLQYDEAVTPLKSNDALMTELARINAAGTAATHTATEYAQMRSAIADLETKRQNLVIQQNLLPSHPLIAAADRQLEQARLQYAASMYRHVEQVKARTQQMATTLHQQEAEAQNLATRATEYAKAELDLKRFDEKLAVLDGRIAELKAGEGAGALRVEKVEDGRPAVRPAKPDVPRTYAVAAALGLLIGGIAAFARETRLMRKRLTSDALARRMSNRRSRHRDGNPDDDFDLSDVAEADSMLRITTEELTAEKLSITRRGTGPWVGEVETRSRKQVD